MSIELLIGIVSAIVSGPLAAYTIWYVVRGRHIKEKRQGHPSGTAKNDAENDKKEKHGNEKWGIDKDSYCYPSINDVMGFEFVRVVKVDDELKGIRTIQTTSDFSKSIGTGMKPAKVTTKNTTNTHDEEGDGYYPDEEYVSARKQETLNKAEETRQEDKSTDDAGKEDEKLTLSPEELVGLDEMSKLGEWTHRDMDDSVNDYDRQMMAIMENGQGRDMVDEPEDPEEADETARQGEALDEYLAMRKAWGDIEDEADDTQYEHDLIARADEEDGNNSDTDGSENAISEEDLPEIT